MDRNWIREAVDQDSDALIHLISGVYAEYPGCILDVERECPELLRPASYFRENSGRLWIAELDGRVAGSFGILPSKHGNGVELHKVYVASLHRGKKIARRLFDQSLPAIIERGARFIELWSDTRFVEGHRFYERLGFVRQPNSRTLNDLSRSTEYHYILDLQPRVVRFDTNELRRHLPDFVELLENCVLHGASVGFVPPLESGEIEKYWLEVMGPIGKRDRILLAALIANRVVGSVQLQLESRRNGIHRAEVIRLLVHTMARRRGVGAALMRACEQAALEHKRKLLVLDTAVGHPAEQLYEKLGYHRAGVIPRYATSNRGDIDTVFMYKELTQNLGAT